MNAALQVVTQCKLALHFTVETKGIFWFLTSIEPWALGITDPDFIEDSYNVSTIIKKEKEAQRHFNCPRKTSDQEKMINTVTQKNCTH